MSKGREVANIVSTKTGIAVTLSGDPLILGVGNTGRVRIWGDDKIGINTTDSTRQINIGGVPDDVDNVIEYDVSMGATTGYAQLLFTTNATYSEKYLIAYQDGHNDFPDELSLKNLGGDITFVASPDGDPADERLRITTGGLVGIGTNTPASLFHINSGQPRLTLSDTGTNAHHRVNADSSVGNLAFDVDYDSATSTPSYVVNIKGGEKFRITSGGDAQITNGNLVFSTAETGIDFSATANGSGSTGSELFNDYEEGTWTPGISFGGGTTGITYSEQSGVYRKIGNYVWCSVVLTLTNKGSDTGTVNITGLPFTSLNNTNNRIVGTLTFYQAFTSASLYTAPNFYGLWNVTVARLTTTNSNLNEHADMDNTYFTNTTQFRGFLEYATD